MKPPSLLGIYREQIFSPGKVGDDAAIMDATMEELSRRGWEVSTRQCGVDGRLDAKARECLEHGAIGPGP